MTCSPSVAAEAAAVPAAEAAAAATLLVAAASCFCWAALVAWAWIWLILAEIQDTLSETTTMTRSGSSWLNTRRLTMPDYNNDKIWLILAETPQDSLCQTTTMTRSGWSWLKHHKTHYARLQQWQDLADLGWNATRLTMPDYNNDKIWLILAETLQDSLCQTTTMTRSGWSWLKHHRTHYARLQQWQGLADLGWNTTGLAMPETTTMTRSGWSWLKHHRTRYARDCNNDKRYDCTNWKLRRPNFIPVTVCFCIISLFVAYNMRLPWKIVHVFHYPIKKHSF